MKVVINISAEKASQLLADNSIHLATHIDNKLAEKRVPLRRGILPVIDPALANGSIRIEVCPNGAIMVMAEWTDKDDDDL